MKRFLLVIALLSSGFAASAETPAQTITLLNGRDLSAWELIAPPGVAATLESSCHYNADGSLAVTGQPMSYLATKESYENYRLHVEWRWPVTAAKNSNSGVLLHVSSGPVAPTAWPVCFQVQLKLNRAGDLLPMGTAKFAEKLSTAPDAKTPQLDRIDPRSAEKPLGEWNAYDIVCRGSVIEVFLNGVPQNSVTACAPASGRIALQLEGTPYELRHLRLDPLPRAIGPGLQTPPTPGGRF
jgi:hypothetical protein